MPEQLSHTLPIVDFYSFQVQGTDYRGRSLLDILDQNDAQLERSHNWIQIVFPLPEGSPFNPSAPLIDKATFNAFRDPRRLANDRLHLRLYQSLERTLRFYGFIWDINEETCKINCIKPQTDTAYAFHWWVKPFDHNHLRITRIIRSLRVLGLEAEAQMLFDGLKMLDRQKPRRIGKRSLMYWERAAKRPLYVTPDDETEEEATGPEFLRELSDTDTESAPAAEHQSEGKVDMRDYEALLQGTED